MRLPPLLLSVLMTAFAPADSLEAASVSPEALPHKVQTRSREKTAHLTAQGARVAADYGSYQLLEFSPGATLPGTLAGADLRDEYYLVLLNAAHLDTRKPEVQALRQAPPEFTGKRLHLVQFVGPAQPAWLDQLRSTGFRIVTHVPFNTYLVYGDSASLARLRQLGALAPQLQWDAPYLDAYKLHPAALAVDPQGRPRQIGTDAFAIQLVADAAANAATLGLLEQLKLSPVRRRPAVRNYVNLVVRLPAENLGAVAAQPDVISIHPYFPRKKFDERQDQIIAGNLSGNLPAGPGYLAWLAGKGFTQAQFDASGFAVDISDSGVDNGTSSPNHFGLYVNGGLTNASRVVYSRLEGQANPGSTLEGCDGHGNLNAHILTGYDDLAGFPFADGAGFHYGLGVCPFVRIGASVIFDPDLFTYPDYDNLQSRAYQDGVRISSNSWGSSAAGDYDNDSQSYDALVRDAQPAGSAYPVDGNQEMVIVFAAGNDGPTAVTIGSPGTAKNVISVGASENVQAFGGEDRSGVTDAEADCAADVIWFSSRGPCNDGRHKPDLLAPGTHVSGGVAQVPLPADTGTAIACFSGSGVSGGPNNNPFFPASQQFYTASSGTSHSTPAVAGACALLRQYFLNQFSHPPSPAMTKAYLMNAAGFMTGFEANDTLWSDSQGMGRMDLGRAFDGTPRLLRDQLPSDLFTASGQHRTFTGLIADTNRPCRVTLAWTDAPGSTIGAAYANDLDLLVTVGGNTYYGNVFSGSNSVPGGSFDTKNNVENVFLPAGLSGVISVQVVATGISAMGVPNPDNLMEQDFALVVYNAFAITNAVIAPTAATLTAESCSPTNNAVDPSETVTLSFALQNSGTADATNLTATLLPGGGVLQPSGAQIYGMLTAGGAAVSRPFTFTAGGSCGGTLTATLQLQDGAADLGNVSVTIPLGARNDYLAERFDAAVPPALPAAWISSATGAQSPWVTTSSVSDSLPNSAFAPDPEGIGLATLLSPVISIAAPAQLTFRNNYDLEGNTLPSTSAFDGGVLEIAIGGGAFMDVEAAGGNFISGGYDHVISTLYGNPLAGRACWSGNSGTFLTTTVNLPAAVVGQTVQFRWLCGSDANFGSTGWHIDSVTIRDAAYSCCGVLVPALISDPYLERTNIIFGFQSVIGQAYSIEYKDSLSDPAWNWLQSLIGDGSVCTVTNLVTAPQRFYRVRSP